MRIGQYTILSCAYSRHEQQNPVLQQMAFTQISATNFGRGSSHKPFA
jgi:hypothetical protein